MMKTNKYIVNLLIENNVVEEEDRQVYEYGLLTMILTVGKVILLLPIFILLGELSGYISFLLGFSYIRIYSGGVHSKSAIRCTVLSLLLILLSLKVSNYLFLHKFDLLPLLFMIVGTVLIFIYAPGKVRNRPITDSERQYFKKKSRRIAIIELILIFVVTVLDYVPYEVYVFTVSMLIQSLNIISLRSDKNEQEIILN